jgi:hypothetical protein
VPTYSVVAQSPSGLRVPLTLSIVSEFPAAKIGDNVSQFDERTQVLLVEKIVQSNDIALR